MRLFKGKAATELGFSTETLRALQSLGEGFALFSRVQVDQYEIDWLTVRSTKDGSAFTRRNAFRETATDGEPWILEDGSQVPNPIDQVRKQAEALRTIIRARIRPRFYPRATDREISVYMGVYCPQITTGTVVIKPRFGIYVAEADQLVRQIAAFRPKYALRPFEVSGFDRDALLAELAKIVHADAWRADANAPVAETARQRTPDEQGASGSVRCTRPAITSQRITSTTTETRRAR